MPDFDLPPDRPPVAPPPVPGPDADYPPIGGWNGADRVGPQGADAAPWGGNGTEYVPPAFDLKSGPRRVGVRPPGAGIALLQIIACSGFPTQILIVIVMTLLGFKQTANPDDWSLGYVGTLLVLDSVVVVSLAILFLRVHGERPIDVFLDMQPMLGEIVRGLLLVPVVFLMVGTIALLVQRYAPGLHQETNPFQSLVRAPYGILIVSALSVIVGGLREEIQRAFVLHRFTQIGAPVIGLLAFSALFGLGHLVQGWDAVIMTSALGLTWGLVYLRRRSIIAPAICHGLFDVIQVAALGLLP